MDRRDELDRSHCDDDPTRTWSTSSHCGFTDIYGYNNGDPGMLYRDAAVYPATARDLRPRRGPADRSHHPAAFAASMPIPYHDTWPPDGGMMMPEPQHMLHGHGNYHSVQAHQHIPLPFQSQLHSRAPSPVVPGVAAEEADRTLQALLTAAGLNGPVPPGHAPLPSRYPSFDPSQHFFQGDPRQEFFPSNGQGVYQQASHEPHSRSTDSLPFMVHPQHPHPITTSAAARPPSNGIWSHTYPGSANEAVGMPPNELGLEHPFPAHIDAAPSFRPAHTLPFSSPPGSPAVAHNSSPSPSAGSAPGAAASHGHAHTAPEAPPSCVAPDLPPLSGGMSMFQIRQLPDRAGKADPRTVSAPLPTAVGGWGAPAPAVDASGAALPYDCLSLPTIHESRQPRRGSHSGTGAGSMAARGGAQAPGQTSSGGFGSPPPRRALHGTHDSFRSNNSGSFKSTSSVNTSFRSGFGSFRSDSFHHDGDGTAEHSRGGEAAAGAAAAVAVAAAAVAAAPPHPGARGAVGGDDILQEASAPMGAATDMSRCASCLVLACAPTGAVHTGGRMTARGFAGL